MQSIARIRSITAFSQDTHIFKFRILNSQPIFTVMHFRGQTWSISRLRTFLRITAVLPHNSSVFLCPRPGLRVFPNSSKCRALTRPIIGSMAPPNKKNVSQTAASLSLLTVIRTYRHYLSLIVHDYLDFFFFDLPTGELRYCSQGLEGRPA